MQKRETMVTGRLKDRVYSARCLSYSSQYFTRDWRGSGQKDCSWWDSFTVAHAMEFERGRILVKLLKDWKTRGMKPMIFAHSRFHQQFAGRVRPSSNWCNEFS